MCSRSPRLLFSLEACCLSFFFFFPDPPKVPCGSWMTVHPLRPGSQLETTPRTLPHPGESLLPLSTPMCMFYKQRTQAPLLFSDGFM